jgi:hypothetical protein
MGSKRWPRGKTLRVQFINGTSHEKERAANQFVAWSKYADLDFRFVAFGESDIRVMFYDGKNTRSTFWAQVGTEAEKIEQGRPTASLGLIHDDHELSERIGQILGYGRDDTPTQWG